MRTPTKCQQSSGLAHGGKPCAETITHHVRNYWLGKARKECGPHLRMCSVAAEVWNCMHPFGPRAEEAK